MADRGNICRSASPHTACNSPVAETKTQEAPKPATDDNKSGSKAEDILAMIRARQQK